MNNVNKKLEEVLKKVNKNDLKKLAASSSVQNIIKNLSSSEREKLLAEFSALDSSDIQKKLEDINNFKGIPTDEIIKKIKSL